MTNSKEWRQFEQLVARIEAAAAPKSAVIKSPDRIRDLVTGTMREVDASIRCKVGQVDVLITIECRKRGRREDDTWIEQLATKRIKIGAAKTIAVSASGFSNSAHLTAREHGIELRTLSEVTAADIESWFLPGGAVHVFREVEDVLCAVFLRGPDGPEKEPYGLDDGHLPVFYHHRVQSPFPAVVMFQFIEMMQPEAFWSIPLDGTKTRLEFTMRFPVNDLFVEVKSVQRDVHYIIINGLVSYRSAVCPIESGVHHVYNSPNGVPIQHTSFDTEMFGMPVRFDHQSHTEQGQIASCEFKSKRKPPEA